MTKTDYPIYADDGTKFCMRCQDEDGEPVIEGPKGKRITVANLMKQVYNPTIANKNRGKIKSAR